MKRSTPGLDSEPYFDDTVGDGVSWCYSLLFIYYLLLDENKNNILKCLVGISSSLNCVAICLSFFSIDWKLDLLVWTKQFSSLNNSRNVFRIAFWLVSPEWVPSILLIYKLHLFIHTFTINLDLYIFFYFNITKRFIVVCPLGDLLASEANLSFRSSSNFHTLQMPRINVYL